MPRHLPRATWVGYLTGLLLDILCTGLIVLLRGALGVKPLLLYPYIPAVLCAALWGYGPALATSVGGVLLADYFIIPPVGSLRPVTVQDGLLLVTFLAVAVGAGWFAARARDLQRQAEDATAQLARQNETLAAQGAEVSARNEDLARARASAEAAIDALGVERDRLRQVVDLLPAAVLICDATPVFILCNRAARELLGGDVTGQRVPLSEAEAGEEPLAWRTDGTPYAMDALPITRALQGEEVQGEQMVLHTAPGGRAVPILASATPQRDEAGEITGVVAVLQDISVLRALERAREEFLSSAAHDLKTPLTAIQGQAQLAQRRVARLAAPEAAVVMEQLAQISAGTQRMARLIDALVDVTRVQMGQMLELEREETDLVALVRRVVARQDGGTTHHLVVETDLSELRAMVDADRLERVVENLLSNAIKYSRAGSTITVRVAREEGAAGPEALIAVRDEGIGIPAADLPHIFERFQRASNVVGHIKGTGIGLASTRHIVEQHGGTVGVESTPGVGSTFTVRLPLEERTA